MLQLLAACLLLAGSAGVATAAAPSLPFSYESDSEEYLIRFTDQGAHAFPLSQAIQAADALDRDGLGPPGNPKGYDHGYEALGFIEPFFSGGDRLVDFWNCQNDADTDCDNGQATTQRIRMPTSNYSVLQNPGDVMSTEACIRMVLGHELFHHVEFAYVDEAGGSGCGPWPSAACEGQARMMQDQIYSDIDTAASSCVSAQGSFDLYLSDTNESVWEKGYEASLFWKYLAEQHGNITQEPNVGSDFIRKWWENAVDDFDTPDIVQLTRETIQDFGDPGVDTSFHNFAIANVLHRYDLSNLSASQQARWSYIDSGQGFGQAEYDQVDISGNQSVSPGHASSFVGFVSDYGALYRGADLDQCPNLAQLRVTIDMQGAYQPTGAFAIIILRDDEVIDVDKKTGTGWSYTRYIPVEPYTRVIVVEAGFSGAYAAKLDIQCLANNGGGVDFPLMMNPNPTHGGGPADAFAVAEVDVDVFDIDALKVRQLRPDQFEVLVGPQGAALPAPVLAVLETPLGQRLRIAVPGALGAGAHRLAVRVAGEEAASDGAILRGARSPDQILVLDRSQSMANAVGATTRFAAMQRAAGAFVDAAPAASRLGIVSFAGDGAEPNFDAAEELVLDTLDDAQRSAAKAALAGLAAPSGPTSIGDGLAEAIRILGNDGDPLQERHLVLLSDGAEGEASSWDTVRAAVLASGARVHTIALGADADQGLLSEIATSTGGRFEFVALTPAATLPGRLAAAFARAADRASGRQRFLAEEAPVAAGDPIVIPVPLEETGLRDGVLALHWDDPAQTLAALFRRPDGSTLQDGVDGVRIHTSSTSVTASVPTLERGTWSIALASAAGVSRVAATGSSQAAGEAKMEIYGFSHEVLSPEDAASGGIPSTLPIEIQASIVDSRGVVTGAAALVEVTHPDGIVETVPLFDDGAGPDARADDGVYSGLYRRTTASSPTGLPETAPGTRGSYDLHFDVAGIDSAGHAFRRFANDSIWIDLGLATDGDGDGLLDRYEAIHDCLAESGASDDIDGDRRTSEEELVAGTDPCESDTDGGGENDGSELARGANPNDPRDDALPAPGHFAVVTRIAEHVPDDPRFVPQPLANLLRVPSAPSYELLLIERRMAASNPNVPPAPWTERARLDPRVQGGAYLDGALPDGARFEYRMRGIDADGNESAVSPVLLATAKQDPVAPIGAVRIPGGPRTDAASIPIAVNLYRDDPADIEMQLGSPGLRGAGWVPYAKESMLPLASVKEPTPQLLTARLRDEAGNESLLYGEQILVYPPNSLGRIVGTIERPGSANGAGVFVAIWSDPHEPVAISASDGSFVLDGLLPGTYEIEMSDADLGARVPDVVVAAGGTTDLGVVPIPEPNLVAAAIAALGTLLARRLRRA